MANIEFIKKDPEQILSDTIAEYQRLSGTKLNPADAEMLLIDSMAYRETLLRGSMEHLMRQNFVQYADGQNLDNWGALWGVARQNDETDDEYRVRILAMAKGTIGTKAAYFARIMAIGEVSDIIIIRKSDDNTLPPGVVKLIPLVKYMSENMIEGGTVHNKAQERLITETITADDFGVIGPVFTFQAAVPVPVNGSVEARIAFGANPADVRRSINLKTEEYFGQLSQKFSGEFGVFDLERKILEASGVTGIINLGFTNIPTKPEGGFYVQGQITVIC